MTRLTRAGALQLLAFLLFASPAIGQARRAVTLGGLHLGGPVVASIAGGVLVRTRTPGDSEQGVLLLLEPGWKGDRASAGWARIEQMGTIVSVRASFLRMRRDPAPTSYAGVEVQYAPLFVVGARLGAFVPLARDREQRPTLVANFSLGL